MFRRTNRQHQNQASTDRITEYLNLYSIIEHVNLVHIRSPLKIMSNDIDLFKSRNSLQIYPTGKHIDIIKA
jgi:hypothetical protein